MNKSFSFLCVTLASLSVFAFASCGGRAKALKKVPDENRQTALKEYQRKYESSLEKVLYAKTYTLATATFKQGDNQASFSLRTDADFAFEKKDAKTVVSAFAEEYDSTEKTTRTGNTEENEYKKSTYLNKKGTYTKSSGTDAQPLTAFYPCGSIQDEALRKLNVSDISFFTLFVNDNVSDWTKDDGEVEISAYSDSSGSGFRAVCKLGASYDALEFFDGIDTFLAWTGEKMPEAALTISFSAFFDGAGGLLYTVTEAEMKLKESESVKGRYTYYQQASVQTSSTVKLPSNLDSYVFEE